MRRLFWVGVGAAAGIGGYRRVSRGLEALAGQAGLAPVRPGPRPAAGPPAPPARGVAMPAAAAAGRLGLRVVRAGGRAARHQASRGAAGFLGDVRDGMSDYLAQHAPAPAHTLDKQRPAVSPAAAAVSRRTRTIDYPKDGH